MKNDISSPPQVDLNQADLETLTTLPGIGPKLAERIIRFREEAGPFEEPAGVMAVPGISERMYHNFAGRVAVSSPDEAPVADARPEVPSPTDDRKQTEEEGYVMPTDEVQPKTEEPDEGREKEGEEYYVIADEEATEDVTVSSAQEGYLLSPQPADSGLWRPWLLMVVGALLGTFLALFVLYSLNNGTLIVANHPKVVALDREVSGIKQRESAINDELREQREQLNQYTILSSRLEDAEAEIQILKQAQDALAERVTTLQDETSVLATRVMTLETRASTLAEQVAAIEQDARQMQEEIEQLRVDTGRFDEFLTRLRDLLLAVQGEPASSPIPPSTGTVTATLSPTKEPTDEPAATAPRPSGATPKMTPTPTPGN